MLIIQFRDMGYDLMNIYLNQSGLTAPNHTKLQIPYPYLICFLGKPRSINLTLKKHTNHEIEPEYMVLIESIPGPTCPTKHKTAFQVLLG